MSSGASGETVNIEREQQVQVQEEQAPSSLKDHLSFRVEASSVMVLRATSALTAMPPLRPFQPDLSAYEKVSLKFTCSLCNARFGMEFWNRLSSHEITDSKRRVLVEWKSSPTSCCQQFEGHAIGFAAYREGEYQLLWGNSDCPTATIKKDMRRNVDGGWQTSCISVFLFPVNKKGNKAGINHFVEFCIDLSVSSIYV